jgi:hypothetical protein
LVLEAEPAHTLPSLLEVSPLLDTRLCHVYPPFYLWPQTLSGMAGISSGF